MSELHNVDGGAPSTPPKRGKAAGATHTHHARCLDYETVALVLQGGGALGAYQAGVLEGLHEARIPLNWVAGISIGALNTAIIAGNEPSMRVPRLRAFWETICKPGFTPALPVTFEQMLFAASDATRSMLTALQAASAATQGQHGFFAPRVPMPLPWQANVPERVSWYDTTPLKATLERFCDFGRINSGETRVSVGAVNVATGNFVYFDNTRTTLRAEHFIASGALPPGFAPVEIDGEFYWDGGVVSNTPLSEVLGALPRRDTLVFQVDLWSARGPVPQTLENVGVRVKDIQYSSRTRLVTDMLQREQRYRHLLRELLQRVPQAAREGDRLCKVAENLACSKRYNVLQLIYQQQKFERGDKDYQFGRTTMQSHWDAGLSDIRRTLGNDTWLDLPTNQTGFVTHDIHRVGE
ncbi:patatin-like phospholipase family protein [Paraburkholderia sp. J63]|uniref:patatin-like phospholipase family protein n=1 Tax=Paraburkholderia sp. J63 TaxID=2805434 RepID=UPI002ABD8FDB|nr:patatin-like phospholipase family protein [Paraburkholderia sp. J63]